MPTSPFALRAAAAAAVAFSAVLAPIPDAAAEGGPGPISQEISYRVYLGGVVVGNATFRLRSDADGYSGVFEVESDGVADRFTEADIRTEGSGLWTARGDIFPSEWVFNSRVDDETLDVEVVFGSAGPETVTADPPYRPRDYEIDPTLQYGALDPISAAIRAVFPRDGEAICDRRLDIFDGRRRYEVVFTGEIKRETRDGAVEVDCAAVWKRLAGYRSRDLRKPGFDFTVRFRLIDGRALPVRAWTDTELGAAVVVMRGVSDR